MVKEIENKAIGRKEIEFKTKKIPSRKDLMKKIAALTNAKDELVIVKKISHKFGGEETFIEAMIYKDKKVLERMEQKHMIARHWEKKPKKAETQAPAQEKKETPKKEDTKTEEKKEEKK